MTFSFINLFLWFWKRNCEFTPCLLDAPDAPDAPDVSSMIRRYQALNYDPFIYFVLHSDSRDVHLICFKSNLMIFKSLTNKM